MVHQVCLTIVQVYLVLSALLIPILYKMNKGSFSYFTILSNELMGACSLIWLIAALITKGNVPHWVSVLQLAGTSAVALTLLTVIFFLAPTQAKTRGVTGLFTRDMLFFHVLSPLAAIIGFTLLDKTNLLSTEYVWLGALPCVLYSVVYAVQVVALKNWKDFYGFTFGGKNAVIPIVIIVMYAVALGISLLLLLGHNGGLLSPGQGA